MLGRGFGIAENPRRAVAGLLLAGAMLLAVSLVGSVVLRAPISHDEHMYLSASRLLDDRAIYADFSFLQTPYMLYVYQLALRVSGGGYVLATARVVKMIIAAALVVVFFGLAVSLSRDKWLGLACTLILVENDVFRHSLGYARNYDMPMLLVLLGVWALIALRARSQTRTAYAAAGVLTGLAIGTKLTYVLVPLAFLAPILIEHRGWKRAAGPAGWFCLGSVVSLLPVAYLCLSAGIDRAAFNLFGYHNLNAAWREQSGYEGAISLIDKLWDARYRLGSLPNQFLFLLSLLVGASIVAVKRCRVAALESWPALTCAGLVAVAVPMFLIPTPAWKSYYAPFVIWLTLLVAALHREMLPERKAAARVIAFGSVFLLLGAQLPDDLWLVRASVRGADWPCVQIHRDGLALKSAIPEEDRRNPVATLTPLYALEGGLTIYPELATGPFVYRIGGLLDAERLERFRTTSAEQIAPLLDRRPPSAILVGFQAELDARLEEYARRNGYEERPDVISGAKVYVRAKERAP